MPAVARSGDAATAGKGLKVGHAKVGVILPTWNVVTEMHNAENLNWASLPASGM